MTLEQSTVVMVVDMLNALHRTYHAVASRVPDVDVATVIASFGGALRKQKVALVASDSPVGHGLRRGGLLLPVYVWEDRAETFRHRAYPDYKATRKERPPVLVAAIEEALRRSTGPRFLRVLGWEADDVIATFVKKLRDSTWAGVPVAIVSGDKDLLQLTAHPQVYQYLTAGNDKGWWGGDTFQLRRGYSPLWEADYKALRGDPSDNLPGVPGIGEKIATRLVVRYGSLEHIFGEAPRTMEDERILKHLTPENFAAAQRWRELTRLVETVPGVPLLEPLGYGSTAA